MVLLNNFEFLVENLKQHIKLDQVQLLCVVVECFINAVVLQQKGIEIQDEFGDEKDLDDISVRMSSLFENLSRSLASFIERKTPHFFGYNWHARWQQEMQVINYIFCIYIQGISKFTGGKFSLN